MTSTNRSRRRPRRAHRSKRPDDPLWRVSVDRVLAAIGDESVSAVARRANIPSSTLHSLVSGRTRRMHWSHTERLAWELDVPADWLTGAMTVLPGVQLRWQDQLPTVHRLLLSLRFSLADPISRRNAGRGGVALAEGVSGSISAIVDVIGRSRARDKEPKSEDQALYRQLLAALEKLQRVVVKRRPRRRELQVVVDAIDSVCGQPMGMTPVPSVVQLAEFRLRSRCYVAWERDAMTIRGFDPAKAPSHDELERPPYSSLMAVMSLVESALRPELWQARFFGREADRIEGLASADQAAVLAARTISALLQPWFDGHETLDDFAMLSLVAWLHSGAALRGRS